MADGGECDVRLGAVVGLAQAMAAAQSPLESVAAAAERARLALGGTFAAISAWEREHGRLRVLVNAGELAEGEERFPADESYPVHDFPEIAEILHEEWAGGGAGPHAWIESAEGPEGVVGSCAVGGNGGLGAVGGSEGPGAGRAVGSGAVGGGGGLGVADGNRGPGAVDGSEGSGAESAVGFGAAGGSEGSGALGGPEGSEDAGGVGPYGAGDAYRHQRVAALTRRGRGSCVVAPIVLHGRAWGELYVARPPGVPAFGRTDADFATVLAAVAAAGIAQTERLEEVRRLAFTDPLTGLGNRRAVDARLDEAVERHLAEGVVVSLVVCDLNGLKKVNDTLGHAVGDRLLERFGSVLSLCGAMLPGTLAARLGGDEFCLLTVGPAADEVVRIADELCRRAAGLELGEGVACGVASTGDPIGAVGTARRLFRLADAAQYRAKAARSAKPVVAGRDGGRRDPVVRLADHPPAAVVAERRRFRGRNSNASGD